MWRSSSTKQPGRHVVCFVVLIVVALGDVRVLGTELASGQVLFHVQPPSMGARLAAERSPQPLSARLKTGATVQFSMAVAAQLGVSLNGAVAGHDRHR
jgi:hypothetical protein